MPRKLTKIENIHKILSSFPIFVEYGMKPSIQSVIALKNGNYSGIQNSILIFTIPRSQNYIVERYVLEVVQAWELANYALKRQRKRLLGVSNRDFQHLRKIRNKLVAHKIETLIKTQRYKKWYQKTYGNFESVLSLVERVADRVVVKIKKMNSDGLLTLHSSGERIVSAITDNDINQLLDACKKRGIY